ncbi:MAG TPA: PKD domain-containing protein [Propionibacteriaceae bacterium]
MTAQTAQAVVAPVEQRAAAGVTADALPTAQIDGVVWDQEIVGDTVYAGGQFSYARPAGVAVGGAGQVARSNIMAYNIRTGVMTSFAPALNGQVKSITKSPDGTRIYVGGAFTTVTINGVASNRYRLAAFNTSDGSLVTSFTNGTNAAVNSIDVTANAVYVGGAFTSVGSASRPHLAAFSPTNGALLGWAPNVDTGSVNAVLATPDRSRVIVAGTFGTVNATTATGLAAIDATSGATLPWTANTVVKNYGSSAAMLSLSTDGTNIYSAGYWFGGTGNFEGVLAADPNSGDVKWLADCHGDTYDAGAAGGVVYAVSHWHYCSNIGGFPDTNPRNQWYRSNAMSVDAKGTVAPNGQGGYANFAGFGAPAMVNWFPTMDIGTFTGQSQAGWTTEGTSEYVVQGGEFPRVNGVAQQGLVRFAIPSLATKKQGPRLSGAEINPTLLNIGNGSVRVKWPTNWDRDDQVLFYDVQRQGTATPVYTTSATSQFWVRPTLSFTDTTTVAGQTYSYRISAYDADGNRVNSNYVSVTPNVGTSAYVAQVINDGAIDYWRMGNTSGGYADYVGNLDLTAGTGTRSNVSGAINGDSDGSATFDGSGNGTSGASTTITAPDTFTAEAWFNTTTTSGGKILGFGDSQLNQSSNYDRHVYMDNAGRLLFGVYNNGVRTVASPSSYNDGQWHQVVAQLSPAGMVLYVDGIKVGVATSVTSGQPFTGRWRVGGDNTGGWTNQPSSYFFAGSIDEVAIYPNALTGAQIRDHYTKSGRTVDIPAAPVDPYGVAVYNDNPALYWRLSDTAGPTVKDISPNNQGGQASGGVSFGQASPVIGGADTAAAFNGADGTVASKNVFVNPTTYSEELWFKTTTTNGGKLIGFGNRQSGTSSSYDRHVYLESTGQLTFGTYTGQLNTTTTARAYNDGVWHHMVATQSSAGMKLYLDGQLSGSNPQTSAEPYNGYWRVGGDSAWCCQPWLNGTIDEVAVYDTALTPAQVFAHYEASPAAINSVPVASFTTACTEGACTFDATGSTDSDGTIASYAWNFGDTDTGIGATPAHGYNATGSYTVTLTVTDNKGATNQTQRTVNVTVPPANQLPTAAIVNTCNELDCTFDGTTSTDPDGSIDTYLWTFGDGTAAVTGASPAHTYAADGTYTVSLKVTDNRGGTHTVTKQVVVRANVKPVASFTTTCTDLVCGFNSSASNDPDGAITAFAWNFGDGSTEATDANPTHTFASPGTYNVKLTVTDDHAATTSKTVAVTVTVNADPVADFSTNCAGLTCAPDGSASTDSDGTLASYSWTYGDGSPAVSGKVPPPHAYNGPGTYDITLTVTDNRGATSTKVKPVTVTLPPNQQPTAAWTSSCSELVCTFDGSGSSDPDGLVVGYAWDFGDTVTASVATPAHTYAVAGTYPVSLTVTDDRGGSSTLTKQVTVTLVANQPPVAAFTSDCAAKVCSFNSTGSSDPDGTVASRAWDFGDGGTSTATSPSHTYAAAGSYDVKLTVTDNKGSATTKTSTITVAAAQNQEPTASFTSSAVGNTVSFDASASDDPDGTIASYAWEYGDGSTGTGVSPTRTFAGTGSYNVKLTVTDNNGATKSTTKTVVVGSNPIIKDTFDRTATKWGNADTGGTYTYSGTTHSTNGSTGNVRLGAAGNAATASLTSVSQRDVNVVVDIATDKLATGGGIQSTLITRKNGTSDYRMTVQHLASGSVRLNLTRVVNGTSTSLRDVNVTAATYTPGSVLRVRFTATGGGTTVLNGKVWKVGTAEPAAAQITASDATAALQTAGSFAVYNYLSGSSTNAPVTLSLDNLLVTSN